MRWSDRTQHQIRYPVPVLRIDAELEVHAVDEPPIRSVRHREQFADLEPVDLRAEVLVGAVKRQVQSLLEPGRNPVRPLGDAVERFVGHDGTRKCGRSTPEGVKLLCHVRLKTNGAAWLASYT